MPDQISQHIMLSWPGFQFIVGGIAGFVILVCTMFARYTFATRAMVHRLTLTNTEQHNKLEQRMAENHRELMTALGKKEDS